MDQREQISAMIDAIVDQNTVDAEAAFDQLMADRLADRIDGYRQDMANQFFNPQDEVEAVGEVDDESQLEDETDEHAAE